jgi:hypothetical protein
LRACWVTQALSEPDDPARLYMHEHQHVQGLEEHRFDGEEVAGDDAFGLVLKGTDAKSGLAGAGLAQDLRDEGPYGSSWRKRRSPSPGAHL